MWSTWVPQEFSSERAASFPRETAGKLAYTLIPKTFATIFIIFKTYFQLVLLIFGTFPSFLQFRFLKDPKGADA
jgi:hypothetical protein